MEMGSTIYKVIAWWVNMNEKSLDKRYISSFVSLRSREGLFSLGLWEWEPCVGLIKSGSRWFLSSSRHQNMLSLGFSYFFLLVPVLALLDESSHYTPSWYQYEDEDYLDMLKKDIKFHPVPGMTVSGPCTWEAKVTRMENRIPRKISEVYCRESGAPCGDTPTFKVSL